MLEIKKIYIINYSNLSQDI